MCEVSCRGSCVFRPFQAFLIFLVFPIWKVFCSGGLRSVIAVKSHSCIPKDHDMTCHERLGVMAAITAATLLASIRFSPLHTCLLVSCFCVAVSSSSETSDSFITLLGYERSVYPTSFALALLDAGSFLCLNSFCGCFAWVLKTCGTVPDRAFSAFLCFEMLRGSVGVTSASANRPRNPRR